MYNVSVSPHLRTQDSTKTIMGDVALALLPILAFGIYHFGLPALFVTVLCVVSSVLFELLFEVITKRPITIFDNSALVTGLILAVNLPASVPWYIPVLGSGFAIIIVKMLFGGLGQNFMNPALAARCFLLISFAAKMSDFAMYKVYSASFAELFKDGKIKDCLYLLAGKTDTALDAVAGATPLAQLGDGKELDLTSLFLGMHGGCIGEVSALAILIGAAYLLIKKVISIRIPGTYILSTVAFIAIIRLVQGDTVTVNYLLSEALSGGLLVGAFFMATDYVTSPISPKGQLLYGVLLGFVTAMFRVVGSSAEGVSYAIIICNLLVPLIEKITVPKPFGSVKAKGDAQ
ncbi:RnfABCDGE type electron transport complex subunit D [uncultured Eubacterium sp.]|mgnify:FL=1|uniref:RnfABCDGE type electron transport complex subunit D n=1 Tax=uncultured Eubacterium sp. TaxID=165185 RepID=UPI002636E0C3|nr:RnfABCDGE type electron transport complex subunit D [uncultured Eubacterium sp.]